MGTFKPVSSKVDFPTLERGVLHWWAEEGIVGRYLHRNDDASHRWSFLDGPITANNPMGVHHAWGRTYKDLFQRYHTMRGFRQRYQNGFDCQGLWVEVEVEKALGFRSKRDIEAFGIEPFVNLCKERVLTYAAVITQQSMRLGLWMDWNAPEDLERLAASMKTSPAQVMEYPTRSGAVSMPAEQIVGRLGDPVFGGSYFTFSNENNYHLWGFLKRCWERGLIYKGHDVMPWCPRCSTGISEQEIVTEGYREITHPGLFVRFSLIDHPKRALLVWTTTPWTLPANVAAAVHPELVYALVRQGGEELYLAEATLSVLRGDYVVVEKVPGAQLVGLRYQGPFDELPVQGGVEHRVIAWKDVSAAEGTGIVHIAPGSGAEDFALSKEHNLPVLAPIDEFGVFLAGYDWLTGQRVAEAAEAIIQHLRQHGRLYKVEPHTHRYPVCWRCETELVFRLVDEWFVAVDPIRQALVDVTRSIRWIPEFGLDRELDWLRNMHDWMISRKRYWGLALPIYECAHCRSFEVLGSEDELRERAIEGWDDFVGHTPHRPWVDAVKIRCPTCGAAVSRIPDVGNVWLDAGIVPFSTLNYRNDPAYWQQWFPAAFITESFPGQYRNWFYSLLVMSTVLVGQAPFRTCLGHALVLDERGETMSKSKGNAIEFNEAADRAGVDVIRWTCCAQNPTSNINFGYGLLDEVRRRFVIPLWNVYAFFVTYANLERIDFSRLVEGAPPPLHLLDRWLLARVQHVVDVVADRLDDTDPQGATRALEAFVDELSNWYVRRCRRRFWKSENDEDKRAAYYALYRALRTVTLVLAPFTPFLSEHLYQGLVWPVERGAPMSVHLCEFPSSEASLKDNSLEVLMDGVRGLVVLGRAARNRARVKVRQPLPAVLIVTKHHALRNTPELLEQITEELNVKAVRFIEDPSRYVTFEIKPRFDLLGPRYGGRVQGIAKAIRELDPLMARDALERNGSLAISIDGAQVVLTRDEVDVRMHEAGGYAAEGTGGEFAVLETTLTPELILEGHARELVHQVQQLRKEAGLAVDDRIILHYEGDLDALLRAYGEYLSRETLSVKVRRGLAGAVVTREMRLNGAYLQVGIAPGQKSG